MRCVQDHIDERVLMVGFMNQAAYERTLAIGRVTFWSRTDQALWTKGQTSRNFLEVRSMKLDCDNDTLLIKAQAYGPTCHRPGMRSCFD